MLHHRHELRSIARLQSRIRLDFRGNRGARLTFVVVSWKDLGFGLQLQNNIEKAIEESRCVAGGKVRASGSTDKERIACKDPVFDQQAHGIESMTRSMPRLDSHGTNPEDFAVFQSKVGKWRRAEPMHDNRRAQLLAELAARRKMVGMGVHVDEV